MPHHPDITPLILAGGLGTRLRPLLADIPKVLAPIHGRPFLTFLLDQIQATGFTEVILCVGYKSEQVREAVGSTYKNLAISYSTEDVPLGTGGALRLALPFIKTDYALVMNGDSYVATDLSSFIDWHCKRHLRASLLLTEVFDSSRFGSVALDNFMITRFKEKQANSGAGLINAGVYLLAINMLRAIPPETFFSLEHDLFPKFTDHSLSGYPTTARFIDIGTPASFSEAENFFANTLGKP